MKRKYALIYILTQILIFSCLAPMVSAANDLSINIVQPQQNGLVGNELKVTVTVSSTYEVKEVLAKVGNQEVPLSVTGNYDNLPSWSGTISLNGLERGEQKLIIKAKDYFNHTSQIESPFLYDKKPELKITDPINGTATKGSIPILVSASDDDLANKPTIEVRIDGSLIETDKGIIDKKIDLSSYDGKKVNILFSAKDSANQTVTQSRYIFVDSNPLLNEATTANGYIVSYGNGKIFYLEDNNQGLKTLKVKNTLTNQDSFIMGDLRGTVADMGRYDEGKYLRNIFPTEAGAIFSVTDSSYIYLWSNGNLLQLGEGENLQVRGNYAIWSQNGDCWWVNLKTGEKKQIIDFAPNGSSSNFSDYFASGDVGADGSVVYVNTMGMFVYKNGIKSKLNLSGYYYNSEPVTDGTSIVFKDGNSLKIYSNGNVTTVVDSLIGYSYLGKQYQINNGWIAYVKNGVSGQGQIWLRQPNGDEKQLTHFGSTSYIYSLSDNGEVVLVNNGKMYFSNFNIENPVKVSSNLQNMYINGDNLYTSIGRSLFQVKVQDKTAPEAPKVNVVGDSDTTITGTAEAGSTVKVVTGEKEIGTVVADGEGNFSIKIETQKVGTVLMVTATDALGNVSEARSVTVQDKTAPEAPKVNAVGNSDTEVTGTAEAGSTVTVKVEDQVLGTTVAKEDGTFSVAIDTQKAGTKLTVTSIDDAGNTSEAKEVVVKDETAPSVPTVNEVTEKSTNITGTAEAGSTVTVKVEDQVLGTTVAKEDGTFSVAIDTQKAGTKLTVTSTDDAGNTSEAKEVVVKDETAPSVPTVNEVTEKSTNITGTAEVGSTVTVKVEDQVLGTTVAKEDGTFSVAIDTQKAGTKLTVTSTDDAGNISEAKEVVVKDETAPSVPTVNKVTEKSTSVTGTAEVGSTVTVKVEDQVLGTTVAKEDGTFSVAIDTQKAGTKLTVTSTDDAGNTSEAKEVVVKDETAPSVPTVNEVTEKSTNITGTAEVGSTVTVKVEDQVLGTTVAKEDGTFSVAIDTQKAGTKLTVTSTDDAGNISEAKEVVVKDETAPSVPTVNKVTEKSTSVTGTAEVGSTVTVKVEDQVLGTTVAKEDGTFSVAIDTQKAGTKLTVTSTDDAGNTSEAKEVVVKDETAPSVPTVNEVTEKSTSVTGTAEAGSTVIVKVGTSPIGEAKANTDGKFTITIPVQKAGTILMVIATDESGNASNTIEVTVKSVRSITAPTVNSITDKTTKVTGKTEGNATVNVKAAGKVIGTGKADAKGVFSITIPVQKAGTVVEVTATDGSKNVSPVTKVTVKDGTAPVAPTVNSITDKTTKVTGKAEGNATVNVKAAGKVIGTGKADAKGVFSITIPVQKAGTVVEVTATDGSKNVSPVTKVTVKDETAPVAPTVNSITDKTTKVTGKTEGNATVNVKAAGKVIGTGKADAKGVFSIIIPVQKAGTVVEITATDGSKNVSPVTKVTVKDGTAPVAPTVNSITDKTTKVTGKAEGNATVNVKAAGKVIGTGKADAKGVFSIIIPVQKAGTVVEITATDGSKNVSPVTKVTVKDGTAPVAPTVNSITDKTTKVTGKAEGNATVNVKAAGKVIGTGKADAKGVFSIIIPVQKAGTVVEITATDGSKNVSPVTKVTVKDETAPVAPTVNSITDKTTKVTGKTEGNATVNVKAAGKVIGTGKADAKGVFSITIPVQKAGTVVEVTATDGSKNVSPVTKVTVKDGTAPVAPTVNSITDKTTKVTGKAEGNATVNVKAAGKVIGTGKADAKGVFSITIPVQKAGTVVEVTATDGSKNVSPVTKVIVKSTKR
ncbi:Ig-like domain-containing protein (plasmid) [Priestia megaterium]|uniref:Ig-like domain-containing protein n=1 Tax=Priestia megaterium TaxID=1404 RepID=UPI0030F40B5C